MIKKYPVLDNLDHDGESYSLGDKVVMDSQLGDPLVDLKVLSKGAKATEQEIAEAQGTQDD